MFTLFASTVRFVNTKDMLKDKTKQIFDGIWGMCTIPPLAQQFIDTYEFQRMRNMKQLGASYYVFSSAEGNRFSHSIGVGHLARTTALHLQKLYPDRVSDRQVELLQVAGLCHDLGHGPYSHIFDKVVLDVNIPSNKHEVRSELIFRYMVNKYNIPVTKEEVDYICETFDPPEDRNTWHYQIISNSVDVDRMDYLIRDSRNIGIQINFTIHQAYGIIKHMYINDDNQIAIDEEVDEDIQDFFNSRKYMYKRIYHHKVTTAIENMIKEIFDRVESEFHIKNSIYDIEKFLQFDDSIIHLIYWHPRVDQTTKDIIDKIFHRQFKEYYQDFQP